MTLACLLFLCSPGMSSTSRVDLFCSVKPFWKHPHRLLKSCVSMVILNSVKLAMVKINHHLMGFVRTGSSPCPHPHSQTLGSVGQQQMLLGEKRELH